MISPQKDLRNKQKDVPPKEERLFRWVVILLVGLTLCVLIALGVYLGTNIFQFPSLFPGRSGTGLPPSDATATAGCELFMQQFPGTPCPSQ